ncbi:MAG: septum formation initiator family protein [Clostridia bacterium]|nr:septum formation initiator family protein [Clostridia bacterium]MBQ9848061.1 septum formation initiator family protein [Clostridia bacterium]
MQKKTIRRSNLVIRAAFILILIFLFVSVINLQVQMNELRGELDARIEKAQLIQDNIDELELRIAAPIDEEYIERVARDQLGYRKPNEIIFVNDIAK